jgi:hypothetical protein
MEERTIMKTDHYLRFRKVAEPVLQRRQAARPSTPNDDWLAICYKNKAKFEEYFPSEEEQEAVVERLARFRQEVHASLTALTHRVMVTGLTYEDLERLRYGVPPPPEESW